MGIIVDRAQQILKSNPTLTKLQAEDLAMEQLNQAWRKRQEARLKGQKQAPPARV
jgi:hypothetical protein